MKSKNLLLSTLFCLLWVAAFSVESEPNDTKGSADVLSLNGSNSGAIGVAGDVDWWKVNVNADGQLDLTLTVSNSLYCHYQLYDNDGTTLLKTSYTNGTQTYSQDGLAPGNYFIKIYAYYSDQLPAYTISNSLTVAPLTNDVEPNGVYTLAKVLAPTGTVTGHIGYYFNGVRDSIDWWKITTTGNGLVNLALTSSNSQYVYWQIFDGNGTTLLKSSFTNGSANYDVDGLAAGTYYIKIYCYFSNGFAPYTLTSTFTAPAVSNDVEPNNTKGQAKNLPVNNSKTGHIGYYYNGARDTSDWYKITTSGDGLVKLTFTSHNGQYVYFQLFDNNGTTSLKNQYTNGTATTTTDGLAAGTYFVKVYPYYSNGFASYTITDSLLNAPVANDSEPNDSKTTATTLATAATITGHVGYYYNLKRDTADWYKIVTTTDGQITLNISSGNGQYIYQTLYDNDGTTILHSAFSNGSISKSTDGLAAGTYYVRVYAYYSDGFIPYTLTSSFSAYTNANDGLSNEYAKNAATLAANSATPGHVGFRSNGGSVDLVDWWKINYTGSGALTVSLNWEPRLCCGLTYTFLQVYADTAAAAIYNQYSNGGNLTANLTALPQQYYYVKVFTYYATEWSAYNLTPTFTQSNKAKITLQAASVGTNCTNGALEYKCTKSSKPYTVQLYQFGLPSGAPIIVNNTSPFTINNLPPGSYYATAYGDGATGTAKGTSTTSIIVPVPTSPNTTNIQKTKAKLNWGSLTCIAYDSVYYRVQGSGTWTKLQTINNSGTVTLSGLTALTTYEWKVAHVATGNAQTATSSYTAIQSFTTLPPKFGEEDDLSMIGEVSLNPNPSSSILHIKFESTDQGSITMRLIDATGRCLGSSSIQSVDGIYEHDVNVEGLAAGMYYVQLMTGDIEKTMKFIKE